MHIHVAHSRNMATVQEALLQRGDRPKKRRKSYSREFKLDIAKFYRRIYQTARRFSLITKTVLQWVKDEDVIKESKKGSNHKQLRRLPLYPEIEERLYHEYKNLRKKRIKVKGYWFRICAKNILEETSPPPKKKASCLSNSWFKGFKFKGFKHRHRISLRRTTNTSQRPPEKKQMAIQGIHRRI